MDRTKIGKFAGEIMDDRRGERNSPLLKSLAEDDVNAAAGDETAKRIQVAQDLPIESDMRPYQEANTQDIWADKRHVGENTSEAVSMARISSLTAPIRRRRVQPPSKLWHISPASDTVWDSLLAPTLLLWILG